MSLLTGNDEEKRKRKMVGRHVTKHFTHLVLTRVTLLRDTERACADCGSIAHFQESWYTREQSGKTMHQATYEEQRRKPPVEHQRAYRCFSCLGTCLSTVVDRPLAGEQSLTYLTEHFHQECAVFLVMETGRPEIIQLVNAETIQVSRLLRMLYEERAIITRKDGLPIGQGETVALMFCCFVLLLTLVGLLFVYFPLFV
jgi:hypothetical protein